MLECPRTCWIGSSSFAGNATRISHAHVGRNEDNRLSLKQNHFSDSDCWFAQNRSKSSNTNFREFELPKN